MYRYKFLRPARGVWVLIIKKKKKGDTKKEGNNKKGAGGKETGWDVERVWVRKGGERWKMMWEKGDKFLRPARGVWLLILRNENNIKKRPKRLLLL